MPSGSCTRIDELGVEQQELLRSARRGVLSTIDDRGHPHSVPVVYVVHEGSIVSPIDDKPKSGGDLARVRNISGRPQATLLVDHWDEDWTQLGWVMVRGAARVEDQNPAVADLLRSYPQYDETITPGERALVLVPQRISWWSWSE